MKIGKDVTTLRSIEEERSAGMKCKVSSDFADKIYEANKHGEATLTS
jgi:hypothetical protein